jgi:putative membrane protein
MMFPYGDPGYMGWMMLGSIVFWTALVAVAIFAIMRLAPRPRDDSAVAILKERLARGEIGSEEYESRRRLIVGR